MEVKKAIKGTPDVNSFTECLEGDNLDAAHQSPFQDSLMLFFSKYSLSATRYFLFRIFQCWGTNECRIKAEISDKEVALFFDQLTDLVAAAYILHQANRVSTNEQEGIKHA